MVRDSSTRKRNSAQQLTLAQLKRRARKLKLILTDNDGVLTDTGVYYSENGEVMKRFSIRDGMGVELLRDHGIETAIITCEMSPSVQKRAEKLKMPKIYLGVKDKCAELESILNDRNLLIDQAGYIGDDINDVQIIQAIGKGGLTAAPADAMPIAAAAVHYRCKMSGGNGAFRDFADWIIKLRE